MSERFIIDTMTWSFSRLNLFHNCAYAWHLQYYECIEGEENFFSQFGSFMHLILEMYAKEELSLFEISEYYEKNFDENVVALAPRNKYVNLRESYYLKGLDYLDNIDLDFNQYKILGVEKKIQFEINNKMFVGYIDLLLQDINGDIICVDHKSASIKFKKNGEPSKTDYEHILEFKRQLYLYSRAIFDEYKKYPTKLKWNLFKEKKWLEIDFNIDDYNEAIEWASNTVKDIETEELWLPDNSNYFFCNNLCNMRNCACEYKTK